MLLKITDFKDILSNKDRVYEIIKLELNLIKDKYSQDRRTEILDLGSGLEDIDLIANERSVVLLTETGYLK